MAKTLIRDTFAPEIKFSIHETNEVDGQAILAKISGQFFVPNGVSRNNRYYTKGLWEKVIRDKDIQGLLKDRRMFGAIGHEQEIDEKALADGKISHIITNLSITEENGKSVGHGEALILNTPAGRILNTVVRAKSKVFVSSRAYGEHQGMVDGVPKVAEDTYTFQTFDFVLNPGFLEANPTLAESYNELDNEGKEREDMDRVNEKMVESILKENKELKSDLNNALDELEKYKNDNVVISEENEHVKSQIKDLEAYKALGEADELKTKLDGYEKELTETKEKLEVGTAQLEAYSKLGTTEELTSRLESAGRVEQKLFELTESSDIDEAVRLTEKAIDIAIEKLEEYAELGTVEDIEAVFNLYEEIKVSAEKAKKDEEIKSTAKELGVSEELVLKVHGTMNKKELKEFFDKVKKESNTVTKYSKKVNEVVETSTSVAKVSRGERLMASFNK